MTSTVPMKTQSPRLIDPASVTGWGVDADPDNDPTYPMRDQSKDHGLTKDWDRPPVQHPDVEILQSIEHNRLPAVVGTSTPPSGLSGVIRRYAFRRSESDWWHWLLLMGADRINVVEGVVEDLARGKVPNIPAELGLRSELRHNRKGFAKKVGVAAVLGVALVAWSRRAKANRRSIESGPAPYDPITESTQ